MPFYPADPAPRPVWAVFQRRVASDYAGPAEVVYNEDDATSALIAFSGDELDETALDAFLDGGIGRVLTWYDQIGGRNPQQSLLESPKIKDRVIGEARALMLEGGSDITLEPGASLGAVYSMVIPATIAELGIKTNDCTVMIWVQASSSLPRQAANPLTPVDGVLLSLESGGGPVLRIFYRGEGRGHWGVTDGEDVTLAPADSVIESQPVILTVISNDEGVHLYQNESLRTISEPLAEATIVVGYIGKQGATVAGAASDAFDGRIGGCMIFKGALTPAQAAFKRLPSYSVLDLDYRRSRYDAINFVGLGDSILTGYSALELQGMIQRLQERFPEVRFINLGIPGSTITPQTDPAPEADAYTQGLIGASLAHVRFSKVRNLAFILGGGNDFLISRSHTVTITIASPGVFTWVGHPLLAGMRVFLATTGTLPGGLTAGVLYYVKTVLNADTFTVSTTDGGAAINTTPFSDLVPQAGTHTLTAYILTASNGPGVVFAGIMDCVDQLDAAGVDETMVGTVLPRADFYQAQIDALNVLLRAGPATHTVTISHASPGIISWTGHGRRIGSSIRLATTGALPSPLAINTTYYVSAEGFGANAFSLSTTRKNAQRGISIATTTNGSGTHSAKGPIFTLIDLAADPVIEIPYPASGWADPTHPGDGIHEQCADVIEPFITAAIAA